MPPAAGTLQQPLLNGSDNDKTPPPHLAIGVVQPPAVAAVTAEGVVPIVLETRGLNYFLGGDKAGQEKQILKGVNLRFSSGVLTAVMGYVGVCVCVSGVCMFVSGSYFRSSLLAPTSIDGRLDPNDHTGIHLYSRYNSTDTTPQHHSPSGAGKTLVGSAKTAYGRTACARIRPYMYRKRVLTRHI